MSSFIRFTTLLLFFLLLFFHIGLCSSASSSLASQSQKPKLSSRKSLLTSTKEDAKAITPTTKPKKKPILENIKNQTKPLKPKKSNSTTTTNMKNIKTISSSTTKIKLQKLNKTTSTTKPKPTTSTKLPKSTTTPITTKSNKPLNSTKKSKSQAQAQAQLNNEKPFKPSKPKPTTSRTNTSTTAQAMLEEPDTEDLIAEFRGLPARLQEALVPDLARLSSTSRAYLSAANAGIADSVKPFLGSRWAPVAASAASVLLLLLPLCLLTALVRRAKTYLPILHRALLFSQSYLAIYFATLALAAALTGLEPLRFFYAASPAAYAWTQAAQSLGYVLYLVLQMVDLAAVFSNGSLGEGVRALGLAQMLVGLAVGLHYYAAVFHRAAAGEAPRANWRVHAVYAICFVVVCACARAETRKKAYVAAGDGADEVEEWKKS